MTIAIALSLSLAVLVSEVLAIAHEFRPDSVLVVLALLTSAVAIVTHGRIADRRPVVEGGAIRITRSMRAASDDGIRAHKDRPLGISREKLRRPR